MPACFDTPLGSSGAPRRTGSDVNQKDGIVQRLTNLIAENGKSKRHVLFIFQCLCFIWGMFPFTSCGKGHVMGHGMGP